MTNSRSTFDGGLAATDEEALERLARFGGGKLLRDMIALFLAAAPERIGLARQAVERSDASGAEQALHSLKSSAAQLGALHMHRVCSEGERRTCSGSLEGMQELMRELDEEFDRVRTWLSRPRERGAA